MHYGVNETVFRYLCDNGAHRFVRSANENFLVTPLHTYVIPKYADENVVRWLLNHDADVNAKNDDGRTIVQAIAAARDYHDEHRMFNDYGRYETIMRPMISKLVRAGAPSFDFATIKFPVMREIVTREFAAFEREQGLCEDRMRD